jgi:disulfide bond formation protein DsbB
MIKSRSLLLAIAGFAFGVVGIALYLQHVQYLPPCPLCVIQRYLFLAVGLACIIGSIGDKPRLGAGLGLIGALGGLGVVGKHLWVLAHPGMSCGIDPMETFLNKIPTATALPWLFKADGLCEDARDTLLGLSIPQWSAISFVALTAALIYLLVRRRA